ncbi:peptidoglycan-binding domain-containing protein [Marinobacter litoralis]|uniref:peptidoglycan-binding domain-containing protein n=1 Tax=Marinobacter litoralis TaxID=187981 RepID=UPI0018ED7ECF|nr:peptidoglycan-binding domain-containing protein [Marinobacter litoralis]MBJ6138612.1 peptidoglycan-binding protein [Marinobacter litoralis]
MAQPQYQAKAVSKTSDRRAEETVAKPAPQRAAQTKTTAEPDRSAAPVQNSAKAAAGENKVQTVGEPVIDIQPGQCWVYAQIHPRSVEDNLEVKVRDSEVRLEITPAEFRRGIKKVVTKQGTKTYRVKPATYKEVVEKVEVKPETTRLVVEPAVYEDVQEEVVLEEARTELEPCRTSGAAAYARASSAFGFCAKEIPAKTKTVTVTKLVKPETTRTEVIPAEYKTVTRWVVDEPAEVIPVTMQDETDALEIAELVKPAETVQQEVPAEVLSMNVKRYEGKPKIVARQAVCDRNLTSEMVLEMQQQLAELGYEPGEHDGLLGPATLDALTLYQKEHGLASGAITIETLEHLELME